MTDEIERFDYLTPAIGDVVEGLSDYEKIYALEQMSDYVPLRTLPGENGMSAIYRLELTESQRKMIAEGADMLVEILHFGGPLAPSRMMLINMSGLDEQEKKSMARWFAAQSKGPYRVQSENVEGSD